MSSTQQKVAALNTIFGNLQGDINNLNRDAVRKQAELVLEEAIELYEAAFPHIELQVNKHVKPDEVVLSPKSIDVEGAIDALGDLLTVVYGVGHIMGVDSDAAYDAVHESNMTKLLNNQDEANAALQVYFDMGVPEEALEIEGEYPQAIIRVVKDAEDAFGKYYPKGKFLKNLPLFKEPDFTSLLPTKE